MPGSLIVVGTGMRLAQQCTPEARDAIQRAEAVYAGVADLLALQWLEGLNANTISLQSLYGDGRTRKQTYQAMTETILEAVRAGKQVCAVFYGHPGVFVTPSHEAVGRARAEGYAAAMLPGVSADACLSADLGVDPGALGCQNYEATDFLINARLIDPTAALILWQIGVVGDESLADFESNPQRLNLLAEILLESYPPDHQVTLYEAATLPLCAPRIEAIGLAELGATRVNQQTTLYIPPRNPPVADAGRLARLRALGG